MKFCKILLKKLNYCTIAKDDKYHIYIISLLVIYHPKWIKPLSNKNEFTTLL